MYAVILAGGGGTRLAPLSRPDRPKQFLPLVGPRSLLQQTVARLAPLIDANDVYVVTERRYVELVRGQIPEVDAGHVVAEPEGRNTAAAVALATVLFERAPNDVIAVLPADHLVADEAGFRATLSTAASLAGEGSLVTIGIEAGAPETRFGYVVRSGPPRLVDGRATFRVERFVEKPDSERAEQLLDTGAAYWNAGIVVARRDRLLDALARHSADIVEPLRAAARDPETLAAVYGGLRATSIDYALLEPAAAEGDVHVVPADVGWSDLGSWASLLAAICDHGETVFEATMVPSGESIEVDEDDLTVYGIDGQLVATPGRRGTIRLGTPAAVLVGAREHEAEVGALLDRVAAMEGNP